MATIQIRDIPDEAYETIRRRARAAGQSIQNYMRDQVVELTSRRTKQEAWSMVEAALQTSGTAGATRDQILEDLAAERR